MLPEELNGPVVLVGLAGGVKGRKKLQKMAYLAKAMGFPGIDAKFGYHWYGPYSEQLAGQIGAATIFGLLEETQNPSSKGHTVYAYRLTETAQTHLARELDACSMFRSPIAMLADEESRFLELAATLHFFLQEGFSPGDARAKVRQFKPERQFTDAEFERAESFLVRLKGAFAEVVRARV